MAFHNLARMYSVTTGTSDAVLTTAVPGCNTWDNAGVTNGETVRYGIITYSTSTHRPTHSEIGTGTYTTATKTLARTTVISSTNSGSKITLTGLSEVFITPAASDVTLIVKEQDAAPSVTGVTTIKVTNGTLTDDGSGVVSISTGAGGGGSISFASYYSNAITDTVTAGSTQDPLGIDTERVDGSAIGSLASNAVTVAGSGYYLISLAVNIVSAAAITANGSFLLEINTTGGDIGTRLPVVNGINFTDATFFLQGLVNLSATNTVSASIVNNTNQSLDVTVYELTLLKLS
jgi:hypothetical protein